MTSETKSGREAGQPEGRGEGCLWKNEGVPPQSGREGGETLKKGKGRGKREEEEEVRGKRREGLGDWEGR